MKIQTTPSNQAAYVAQIARLWVAARNDGDHAAEAQHAATLARFAPAVGARVSFVTTAPRLVLRTGTVVEADGAWVTIAVDTEQPASGPVRTFTTPRRHVVPVSEVHAAA